MQYLSSIRSLILHCFIASVFLYSCGSSPSSSEGEEATSQIEVANEPEEEQPTVVFVTGDHEYSSEGTMPKLAAELEQNYGLKTVVLKSSPDYNAEENIPGLEALQDADMAVFFLRWRRLPADQVKHIEDYLKTGKPAFATFAANWACLENAPDRISLPPETIKRPVVPGAVSIVPAHLRLPHPKSRASLLMSHLLRYREWPAQ